MRTASYFSPRFSEAKTQFLELRKSELRNSTLQGVYKPSLNNFQSLSGDKAIGSYSPLDIQQFIQLRLKTVSPTTVNIELRSIKSFGRWLLSMDMLPEKNAFTRIKQLRLEEKPIRFLTKEEFQRVLEAEHSDFWKCFYKVAVLSGIRLSALLALKWQDVDLDNATITLQASTSKTKRTHLLPLNLELIPTFKTLQNPKHIYVFQKPSAVVPVSYDKCYVSRRFHQTCKNVGLDFGFHCLRKSFACWALESTDNIFAVSKLLTHSSVVTTEKFYARFNQKQLAEVMARVNL